MKRNFCLQKTCSVCALKINLLSAAARLPGTFIRAARLARSIQVSITRWSHNKETHHNAPHSLTNGLQDDTLRGANFCIYSLSWGRNLLTLLSCHSQFVGDFLFILLYLPILPPGQPEMITLIVITTNSVIMLLWHNATMPKRSFSNIAFFFERSISE